MTQHVFIHEPAREVRVSGDADVIVCVGGPAGVVAALLNSKELPELSVEAFHQAGGNPHRNQ